MAKPSGSKSLPPRSPLLEWIAAALGGAVVLAALALLGAEALRGDGEPADVTARALSIQPATAGWRVEIEAENHGDQAAAEVVLEARAGAETASVTLAYVPGQGRRKAAVLFADDPGATVQVRAVGWTDP